MWININFLVKTNFIPPPLFILFLSHFSRFQVKTQPFPGYSSARFGNFGSTSNQSHNIILESSLLVCILFFKQNRISLFKFPH